MAEYVQKKVDSNKKTQRRIILCQKLLLEKVNIPDFLLA
jgi:hypothetical protein